MPRSLGWASGLVVAMALLVSAALAAVTLAGAAAPERRSASPRLDATEQADRRRALDAWQERRDDPKAKAARERSRRQFAGKSDAEALAVAREEHAGAVEAQTWRPPHLPESEHLAGFADDFTVKVQRDGRRGFGLVQSTMPLRAVDPEGRSRMLDYALEDRGETLVPNNPLVDVRLPKRIEEGVTVGRLKVHVDPRGHSPRAAAVRNKGFWGNVDRDTDVLVVPTPVGIETFHHLRSEDSPETLRLRFELPPGAHLERVVKHGPEGLGGTFTYFQVVQGKERLARIMPPSATDADGAPVPVETRAEGTSLLLRVEHRGKDLRYPLLVDPYIDHYDWNYHFQWDNFNDADGWYHGWSHENGRVPKWFQQTGSGRDDWGEGLYLYTYGGTNAYHNYEWGDWRFSARGNAHIPRVDYQYVKYEPAAGDLYHNGGMTSTTYLERGICHSGCTAWEPGDYSEFGITKAAIPSIDWWSKHYNAQTYCSVPGCNWGAGGTSNTTLFRVVTPGTNVYRINSAWAMLGVAHVTQWDRHGPFFHAGTGHDYDPNAWTNRGWFNSTVYGRDDGLGMHYVRLYYPGNEQTSWACDVNVERNRFNGCPRDHNPGFGYGLPEGISRVEALLEDFSGNRGSSVWWPRVDRGGPGLEPSGALWNARGRTVTGSAPLHVRLWDGSRDNDGTKRSGVQRAELWVDGQHVTWPAGAQTLTNGSCPDTSCTLEGDFDFDAADWEDGEHRVQVKAWDFAGNGSSTAEFRVIVDTRPPDAEAVSHANRPTGWFDTAEPSVLLRATDDGGGVKSLMLESPTGWTGARRDFACDDTVVARCATTRNETITYNRPGDRLPEGASVEVRGRATDPAGHDPATLGRGLQVHHWDNNNFTGPLLTRNEARVDYDFGLGSPDPRIGADTWTTRWLGQIEPRFTELYTFTTLADDGTRLWVDGKLVIDNWVQQGPIEKHGQIALQAGRKVDIRLEYFEEGGGAVSRLYWSSPSQPREIVPAGRLFPPADGLRVEHFDNMDFTGTRVRWHARAVNNDWGTGSPEVRIAPDTFSSRWTGQVTPRFTDDYTFWTIADDGTRLWIDGRLVIDDWTAHGPIERQSPKVRLEAGRKYDIKLEYFEEGGGAAVQLGWQSVLQAREIIPTDRLAPPRAGRTTPWHVKVDHSDPTVDATSDAFEPKDADERVYDVKVTSSDALSGMDVLEMKVDDQPVPNGRVDRACTAETGCEAGFPHTFKLDTTGYAFNSRHKVDVIARDAVNRPRTVTKWFQMSDNEPPTLKVEGGLRTFPVNTGRELTATATDTDAGVRDVRVFVKPTDRLTPDAVEPIDAQRVKLDPCSTDCRSASGFASRYRLPDNYPTGRYQFVVRAYDKAGKMAEDRWILAVVQMRSGRRTKLGLEHWFELDDTDAGAAQSVIVNGDTGNLVWHSVPIVNPGRGLSSVVNVTYNSQDRGGIVGADVGRLPLAGVNPDDDEVLGKDLTGLAYREAGVNVSLGVGGPTRVNEALGGVLAAGAQERAMAAHDSEWLVDDSRISLTDADGTQHVFVRNRGDRAWRSPAGFDMRLRYVGARQVAAVLQFTATQLEQDEAWELLRPDGVRFVFDSFGYLQKTVDRNGNALDYVYKGVSAITGEDCAADTLVGLEAPYVGRLQSRFGLCVPQLREVRQPTWKADQSAPENKRRITLEYTPPSGTLVDLWSVLGVPKGTLGGVTYMSGGAPQVDTITDATGRKLKFEYYAEGHTKGFLKEIRENDAASGTVATGDVRRVTRLKYDEPYARDESRPRPGDVQQLTAVVPVVDGVEKAGTQIAYEPRKPLLESPRPHDPRRATKLTKRGGAPKLFRYAAAGSTTPQRFEVHERTLGTRHLSRLTDLDASQRPARVTERASELASEDAAALAVAGQGQTVTELEWNDQENKLRTLREGAGTPEARTTTYAYRPGGSGALAAKTVAQGTVSRTTTFTYHAGRSEGFVADVHKIALPGGRVWTYDSDERGNVRYTTNPNGVKTETRYDATKGFVISEEQDENGRWTTLADHDPSGQPQTVTKPGDANVPARVWRYRYDARGDVTKVIDPRAAAGATGETDGFVTTLAYDAFSRLIRERMPRDSGPTHDPADGPRFVERTRRFDRDGNAVEVTDASGATTRIDYDAMGKPIAVHEPGSRDPATGAARTETSRFVLDDAQRVILEAKPLGGTIDAAAVRSGHLAACEQPTADQGSHAYTVRHCLDHRGQPRASARYSQRAGDLARRVTAFAYDGLGRLVGQNDANRNAPRDDAGRRQPLTLAAAVTAVGDASKRRLSYEYDLADRLTKTIERPSEAGAAVRTERRDYDDAGDLVTVTQEDPDLPDRITEMDYDAMGRELSRTDPLGRMTCLKRQNDGLVVARTTARGTAGTTKETCADPVHRYTEHTTRLRYDAAGGLVERSIPYAKDQYGPTRADVRGWTVRYERDVVGNPFRITDGRGNAFENRFYDGGELKWTDRPSFWDVQWPEDQDAGNPEAGERYDGSDAADVEVAENGPRIAERDGRSANAERSGKKPPKPQSLGKGDFGEIERSELPAWLPQAGRARLRYDGEGRLTHVFDVDGKPRHIGYDAAGRVDHKSWPLDAERRIGHDFAYDAHGNLTSVTEDWRAGERVDTTFGYDGYDRRIEESTVGASQTSYDGAPVREVTRFAYDANDNLERRTTPRGTAFAYGYDSLDQLSSESNPTGETWRYRYDRFGDRIREIAPHDPAKSEALYTAELRFDKAGQLSGRTLRVDEPGQASPRELVWSFDYDADGNKAEESAPGAGSRTLTKIEHDGRGLPWRRTVSGDGAKQVTVTEHDANGNLRRQVRPAGIGAGDLPKAVDDGTDTATNLERAAQDAVVRVYDEHDLQVSERLPWRGDDDKRFVRDYERGPGQRLVRGITLPHTPGASTIWRTSYAHNDAGWIVESSDSRRSTSTGFDALATYTWDEQGHQTRWRSRHAGQDDRGRDVRWEYWPNGQLRRRTAVKTQDAAGTQDDPTTRRTYDFMYNLNRSLVRVVDSDAVREQAGDQERETVFARDGAERETRVDEDWTGGKDVLLRYDGHTGELSERRTEGTFDGDAYGGDDAKVTTFDLDSLGRELKMTVDPAKGDTRVTETRWHDGGQMRERTKPNGTRDVWTWNAIGQKTRHERIRKGQTDGAVQPYAYDDNGNRTEDERGEHRFNARDQLVWWKRSSQRGHADRRGWTTEYTVDGSGAVLAKDEKDGGGALKLEHDFTYDGERLRKVVSVDRSQPLSVTTTQTYRHDDAGNVQRIYSEMESTAPISTPAPGDTGLNPEECEADDSTVSRKVTAYCYDEFNRQVFSSGLGVKRPAYVSFDGLDRRDRKVVEDALGNEVERRDYAYIGTSELLTSESVKRGLVSKRNSYDYDSQGDRQGQQVDRTTGTSYRNYAKDANGSVVGLEQADGTINEDERYDYDPYGELDRKPTGDPDDPEAGMSGDARENPFRFEGFYYDSGVKTYDMHARHYRPDVGRFLSRDQFASAAGDQALQADPLTQNRYAFAGGNPVNNVEFDGHWSVGGLFRRLFGAFANPFGGTRASRPRPARRPAVVLRRSPTLGDIAAAPRLQPIAALAPAKPRPKPKPVTPQRPDGFNLMLEYLLGNDPPQRGGSSPKAPGAHEPVRQLVPIGQLARDQRQPLPVGAGDLHQFVQGAVWGWGSVMQRSANMRAPHLRNRMQAISEMPDGPLKRHLLQQHNAAAKGNRAQMRLGGGMKFATKAAGPAGAVLSYADNKAGGDSNGRAAFRTGVSTAAGGVGLWLGGGCGPAAVVCSPLLGGGFGWAGNKVAGPLYDAGSDVVNWVRDLP